MSRRDKNNRARLVPFARDIQQMQDALARVSTDCHCRLHGEPGYGPLEHPGCPAGRRCRAMTVLTIQTRLAMIRVSTRHLAAADIPRMVEDLHALLAELDTTTDWLAYAQRLQRIVNTGLDPDRPPAQPSTAEGAPRP